IGLDRGQLGPRYVVTFQRIGPKVLMVEPNYAYRAEATDNPAERRAVEEAFAKSVIWGFQVAAEEDGRVLVDATEFFLRDAHGVVETLRRRDQGTYSLDKSRSAPHRAGTRAFPRNTEVEVVLTYTGNAQHPWIRSVAPTPDAVTVRQHYSFVQLPERGEYTPRRADPRAGYGGVSYVDYAAPLGQDRRRWFVARHRLEKRDPGAAMGEPVEPIVYYLDRGTPEPVRSALLEGARWWNQAFEAAGYRNAFRVEMMPEGADPMDLRYNVIQWVHRSTRGWSYGSSVVDPRTGEILKGHVTLGSLRVRQDYLIAEGLLSPYADGETVPPDMERMALARIRQLSAHEVGHTLGLAHNYISSAQGPDGRASVMDYPHPRARLAEDGTVDLSRAYDTGIGEWDRVAIEYGYRDFPEGTDEQAALTGVLMDAEERGITFISDQDARPAGSAHPLVHLWDNGRDAATELGRKLEVRAAALERLGEASIRNGQPLAVIEEALVPLYLHHRYQVEAVSKVVGGLYYTYALRGDGQEPLRPVGAGEQRRALETLLTTLEPGALTLPESLLRSIPPRPFGYGMHRELFPRHTGLVFDALSPAEVAADMSVSFLLHPERAARLVEQHARDPDLPGFTEVVHALVEASFEAEPADGYEAEVGRVVQRVVVDRVQRLAARASMPQVRAEAAYALEDLVEWMDDAAQEADRADQAHFYQLASDVRRFLDR
ncbi:MAG TPA: zinc-dependent metalloprotease, partial [Longimicrobiales bacterium]|nr:zinc-dependent metalloprotease [Longimicrobiales bacterium]